MRRFVLSAVAAVVLAGAVVAGWLWLDWHRRYPRLRVQPVVVEIARGMPARAIARTLAEAGVIRHRWSFELLCLLRGRSRLEAGEYRFDRPLSPLEVYDWLAQGRVWVVTVTVPEGWTRLDIANELDRLGLVGREQFLRATADPGPIRDIAPRAPSLEGFLFPATYRFPHRITAEAIAAAMVRQFRQQWAQLTAGRPGPADVLAVVTLASLVAALEPAEVPYLYFVADGSGGHVFSRTLAEHHRNVARYRQQRLQEHPAGSDGATARRRALADQNH